VLQWTFKRRSIHAIGGFGGAAMGGVGWMTGFYLDTTPFLTLLIVIFLGFTLHLILTTLVKGQFDEWQTGQRRWRSDDYQ